MISRARLRAHAEGVRPIAAFASAIVALLLTVPFAVAQEFRNRGGSKNDAGARRRCTQIQ
jgi:hypothetical protein